jgi:hypothetical protein
VQALRVQIDTKKWLLSKLAPARYGEHQRLSAEITGANARDLIPEPEESGLANLLSRVLGKQAPVIIDAEIAEPAELSPPEACRPPNGRLLAESDREDPEKINNSPSKEPTPPFPTTSCVTGLPAPACRPTRAAA